MEIGSVGASNKGVLVSQSTISDARLSDVLAPLKSSYLHEESEQFFKYTSTVLIKNAQQEKKYNAFREKKGEQGYSEEDLRESFGFLLFSSINKATKLGETGVLVGNSTCKTLGDPTKGVYISQYSDCLDQHPWSHGKSGYIAIIKLTKGRVKEVSEKYTQNVTAPTRGFDCHTSTGFSTVVSSTSSLLVFQRTQCYLYEFLGDGSNETVQCPSAACVFAIVSFLYIDPKVTFITAECKSEQRELGRCYFPWTGQLHIGLRYYSVGLRATAGALIPAELPTVVKVDRVISMSDLRRVLPKATFQTRFAGEVFLGDLYYSLCELVSSEVEQANTLNLLLQEIKAKDVALTVPLNDSGFLILLPSSYFCDNDSGSSTEEFLQGIFVFPESRIIHRDSFPSEDPHRSPKVSPEILRVLPVLSYSEAAAEETSINPSEKLSEVFEQQLQNHTSVITPGMAASPKENGISDSDLSSVPEWTNAAWQNFSSYLRKPDSFQIPVSKTSDILFPAQEKEVKDVDSVSQSMLSPEEVPTSHVTQGSVGRLTSQNSAVNKSPVDGSTKGHTDIKPSPQSVELGDLLIKTGDMETKSSPSSGDLRAELIVSITSAAPTVSGSDLDDTESKTKCNAFQQSGLQAEMSVGLEKNTAKKDHESTKKAYRGTSKGLKPPAKACPELEHKHKDDGAPDNSQLHNDINSSETQTRKFGKLSKNRKLKSATVVLTPAGEKKSDRINVPMKLEVYGIRRKMEHWDLKPVVSKCGRILVPHGSVNAFEQIKDLRNATQSPNYVYCEKTTAMSMNVDDTSKTEENAHMEKASAPMDEDDQHQKVLSHVCPGPSIFQQPDDKIKGSSLNPQSSGNKSADALPRRECFSPENPTKRVETLISKLKSVLRTKTKPDLRNETTDNPENVEHCVKRGKFETDLGPLKSAAEASGVPDDDAAGKVGLSTLLSVDPHFAFALGLTPRMISNKMVISEAVGVRQRKRPAETKDAAVSASQQQIIQSPQSIIPQKRRSKMLRRHQGTSTENTKEKWWLHFQGLNRLKSEDLRSKEDHADRGTAEQSSCFPTDGLNLLADLALCATSNQLPSQPEQAQERRLKNLSCKNDYSVGEQESVLHALLRQPAARSGQPLQSPPPIQNVRDSELAALISKEHAYSMHPSTSLLLDFSILSFEINPLNGCTRLLSHHHQTQNLAFDQGDKSNHQTPECTEIQTAEMKRFRHSRTFAIKDRNVQVTKRWKRNYDFGLDSKFSNDPQCRTICRALHGPWDFSVKDTSDEVRLIFHLWVALFYSRSMPRSFDFDPEASCMETLTGSVSTLPLDDLKASPFAPDLNVKDRSDALISTPFDHTTNDIPIWGQRSEVLDLSKKNSPSEIASSVSQVIPVKTCETLNSPMEPHTKTPFQCYRNVYSTETIREVNDISNSHDSKTHSILQEHPYSCPQTAGLRSGGVLPGHNKNTHTRLLDSRDKEVSGVHEEKNPSQEVSMEAVPQLMEAGNVSAGVFKNGDLFGKEKQLCVKEPDVVSPVKAVDGDEGMDCCPSEDSVSKELTPKEDITSSYLRADLNDGQSQMMSTSSESAENVSVTENNHQSEQEFCFTDVRDQQLFQHDGPDMRNEPGSKADDSQQRKRVVDEPHNEKAGSIVSNETAWLLDGSIPQTNSNKIQDHSRTVVDVSCSLTCDKTREGSEKSDSQVPRAEECTQDEDATQPQEPGSDGTGDEAECQKETPFINETASSCPADTQKASCLQKVTQELSDDKISPSPYDDRCPTPTLDEEPCQYTPSSGPSSSATSSTSIVGGETLKPASQTFPGQIFILLKPKIPLDKTYKAVKAVKSDINPPLSAPAVMKSSENHPEEDSQIQTAGEKLCFQGGKPQATSAGKSTIPSQSSCLSNKCLQTFKPNTGNDGHGTPPETSVEMPACSPPLVMPANISKREKTRGKKPSRDPIRRKSKPEPSKTPRNLKSSGLSEQRTKNLKGHHKKGQFMEKTNQRQTISLSKVNKPNLARANHLPADPLHQFKRQDSSELKRVVQIVGKEPRKCSAIDQEHKDASRSGVDFSDGALRDDAFCRRPQGSLRCTISNSRQKRSRTFLEQMSERCLQEDLTQASVEEECLIFSEQMKQVVKRSKEKSIHMRTRDTHEHLLHLFRSSSAATRSCQDLESKEVRLDPQSFVGLKITVDMSERTPQTAIKEEEISHSGKLDGVAGARAGWASRDSGKMADVCAPRRGPVRQKDVRMDGGEPKTDPSHLSNPPVKREGLYKSVKLVVKGCSKTKYRFYILVTSADPCFDETKAQLEAQGHTAVQPSEFFLEESSSTLLIILRNEDIAEHICEVPYLLSLKKSPGVQFAGIDEPDDVVNETHQELFVKGGFIMFDRAALESLRLRDMKILSEILQELSRSGRWKWFLHYRHSRWLTEKSRLSGEAREKKNFISWCQEAGILEVLPYHECDRLSRDQPDYLTCLVRLQVQNVSARYPIFITEMTTNSSFGTNGILTLTLSSFLSCKTFLV